MNFAIILASGQSNRIKSQKTPKQFIKLHDKPIFVYTLEKFITNELIDYVILVINKDWEDYVINNINTFFKGKQNKIYITFGSNSRSASLKNGFLFLRDNLKPQDDDVILTHDCARIFVSDSIINANINLALSYDALIDTGVNAIDTIAVAKDNINVDVIPKRDDYFYTQTPQTIKYKLLVNIFNNNFDLDVFNNCDLAKLAMLSNIKVILTKGDYLNFKITTDFDLLFAEQLVKKIKA